MRVRILIGIIIMVLLGYGAMAIAGNDYSESNQNYKVVYLNKGNDIFGFNSEPYTLGKDDVIQIDVQGHPEFSGKFTVSPDGKIQYQYIGDVKVEGLTKEEVREKIKGLLSEYIHEPQVMVKILEFRSKYIYVMGEVGKPGKYPMNGSGMSVRDAIIAAGLVTSDAGMRGTRLIRPAGDKVYVRKVDICKILYEGMLDENYMLKPGDIIYVPTLAVSKISRVIDKVVSPFYKAAVVKDVADIND